MFFVFLRQFDTFSSPIYRKIHFNGSISIFWNELHIKRVKQLHVIKILGFHTCNEDFYGRGGVADICLDRWIRLDRQPWQRDRLTLTCPLTCLLPSLLSSQFDQLHPSSNASPSSSLLLLKHANDSVPLHKPHISFVQSPTLSSSCGSSSSSKFRGHDVLVIQRTAVSLGSRPLPTGGVRSRVWHVPIPAFG